jgi:high-affinity iron transporter
MFLDTVILVLQEILEAALIISVLLTLTRQFRQFWPGHFTLGHSWILASMLIGFIGAWIYASYTSVITLWFDYFGLEVLNALIQFLIIFCLLCLSYSFTRKKVQNLGWLNMFAGICITLVVALGIIREVSEIILYGMGILAQPENYSPFMLGVLIALGIGASSGIILYYLLATLKPYWSLRLCMLLLALYAGNMASQASLLLVQADWLPFTEELWDSSFLLPEYTVPGQLMYALIGYEANPSVLQAAFYCGAVLLIILSPLFRLSWKPAPNQKLIIN